MEAASSATTPASTAEARALSAQMGRGCNLIYQHKTIVTTMTLDQITVGMEQLINAKTSEILSTKP